MFLSLFWRIIILLTWPLSVACYHYQEVKWDNSTWADSTVSFSWKYVFTLHTVRLSHINENLIQVWNWNHFDATFLKPSHTLLINEAPWLKKHKGGLNKQWKYVSKTDWQVKPFVSQLWKPNTLISLCNYIPWNIELCTLMQTWGFRLFAGQQ